MEFKIPSEFQLLSRTFKIIQVPKISINGELGMCYSQQGIIKLRKNLKRELKEQIFWHETVHSILDSLGYDKLSEDESLVDSMGSAIYQVIKTMK